jgi:hypothetical protein
VELQRKENRTSKRVQTLGLQRDSEERKQGSEIWGIVERK